MKFQTQEYHTSQSSNVAGQAFQVSMTAKFFETLFSGLYRYKEAAVQRELFCNAIDSHKMRDQMYSYMPQPYASVYAIQRHVVSEYIAEQNTPVEIHLPDELEPWLEIKDFGIGLSLERIIGEAIPAHEGEVLIEGNIIVKEDEVPEGKGVIGEPGWYDGVLVFRSPDNNEIIRSAGLYTTLFDSTKADSNDQIGAFGLGSKSPFAVSDSFTVESRYNGQIHNFFMFLNEKRIPTCELTTKDLDTRDPEPIPTEEKNGLTVRVPVRQSSYQAFADQLSDLCRVLLPHEYPVVTNADYFDGFTPISRDHKVYDTYVQKSERKSHASTHYAVMGGVAYPIELDQLDPESKALLERFPSTYTFFPLGALNVPPSREDLSYDQFTKAALQDKMVQMRQGILESAMAELKLAQSKGPLYLVMTKGKYSEMYGSGFRKMLDKTFPPDPRFNDGHIAHPKFQPEVDMSLPASKEAGYNFMLGSSGPKTFFHINRYNSFSREDDVSFEIKALSNMVLEDKRPVVIIMDNNRCFAQKIKQYLAAHPKVESVWLVNPNPSLLTWRDLELDKQYKNHKEIKDTITTWIGSGKTVDYLQFADQFSEYYDGLVNPTVVFMSELPYEALKITGDIGMLEYARYTYKGRYRSNRKIEGTTFNSEKIIKVAEQGLKMIYVTYSGHDMVHEGMNDHSAEEFQQVLGTLYVECKDPEGKGWKYFCDEMGWYGKIVMVRKKAVPFLKQNSDFFIDIRDAIKQLDEKLRPIMEGIEYGRFSETSKKLAHAAGNINYLQWILEQIGARYDLNAESKLDKHYTNSFKIQSQLRESSVFAKECRLKYDSAVKEYGVVAFKRCKSVLETARELLSRFYKYNDISDELVKANRAFPRYEHLEDFVATTLYLNRGALHDTRNKAGWTRSKVLNSHRPKYEKINSSRVSRQAVRKAIEAHKLLQFINTDYKATMGSRLGGADELIASVVERIKENLRF